MNYGIAYSDLTFEHKTIYLSGGSFRRCTFRSCTLVLKDVGAQGSLEECTFEKCVWHLNMTVADREAWQVFLARVAPAIMDMLPTVKSSIQE